MPATRVLLLLHVHVYSFTTRVLLLHLLINYELFYSCNVNSNQPMLRGLSCRIVWMSSSHWRRVSRLGRGRPNSNSPLCRRSLKRWRERIVIMLRNYAKQWNKYVIFTRITHFYCLILIIIILYIYVRELLKHISFIFFFAFFCSKDAFPFICCIDIHSHNYDCLCLNYCSCIFSYSTCMHILNVYY